MNYLPEDPSFLVSGLETHFKMQISLYLASAGSSGIQKQIILYVYMFATYEKSFRMSGLVWIQVDRQ
jgi:hypothetical protein